VRPAPQPVAAAVPEPRVPDALILSDMAKQLEEALKRPVNSVAPAGRRPEDVEESLLVPTAPPRPAGPPPAPQAPARPAEPPRPVAQPHPQPVPQPQSVPQPHPVPPAHPAPPAPVRTAPPPPPPQAAAPEPPPARRVEDPFSVEEIEAEFARLLGRPLDKTGKS
jgi:hypothetical protein